METHVFFTPGELREDRLRGRTVVVIDVLRASTTIITALASGARGVIPCAGLEEATERVVRLGIDDVLLAAEREGHRVEGCDLGNSPAEYTPARVKGHLIVLATTNGTRAIAQARGAGRIVVGSYVNAGAVLAALTRERALVVVCAGNGGAFALEDAACAGYLLRRLAHEQQREIIPANDGAWVALELGRRAPKTPVRILRQTAHGRHLIREGFEDDLAYCAQVDRFDILPMLRDNLLVRSE